MYFWYILEEELLGIWNQIKCSDGHENYVWVLLCGRHGSYQMQERQCTSYQLDPIINRIDSQSLV